MKEEIKIIVKYILIYIIMIIIFIVALCMSAIIPKNTIQKNVKESEKQLEQQNLSEEVGILKKTILDNYTDAVMINTAYSIDTNEILKSVMLDRRSYNPEKELESADNIKEVVEQPVEELKAVLNGTNNHYFKYARYWHGYLIILRPLLALFNYKTIRIISFIIIDILIGILTYLVYKKIDKWIAVILLIAFSIFSFQYAGLSLTYFSVLAIALISSIIVIIKKEINPLYFFIIGRINKFF